VRPRTVFRGAGIIGRQLLLALLSVRHASFESAECIHVGIVLIEAMVLLAEHLEIPRSGSVRGTAHDTLRLSRRGKPRLRGHCAV
jgi:hypothetical protein